MESGVIVPLHPIDWGAAWLAPWRTLWESLVRKDWQALFGPLRPLWAQSRLVLFGHALIEKLVFPRKPINAHVLRVCGAINLVAYMGA